MVGAGSIANPSPKYRNAIAVRTVSGGAVMNVLTVPGVANEPLKEALEATLSANGYLAASGHTEILSRCRNPQSWISP